MNNKKMTFAYFRNHSYCDNLIERDYKKIDVINYAFAKIRDGKIDVSHLTNLTNVVKLKDKGLKVVIVIDGVSDDTRDSFRFASKTEDNRKNLADSACEIIQKYNLDGVDLDWEFPTGEEEIENFTLLVKEIREKLDRLKERKILSIATLSTNFDKHYDLKKLNSYIDYMHVMTYGMGSKKVSSHHSPLYNGDFTNHSVSTSLEQILVRGISEEKIIFGAPFFVRIGEISPSGDVILNNPIADGTFKAISYTKFLNEIKTNPNFKEYYDEKCQAYYSFDGKTFATYENPKSIENKCKFIIGQGLGGIMFWDYGHDKESGMLLDTIYKVFNK